MQFPRFFNRSPIGVDIGDKSIKALQLAGAPGAWRVAATACMPRSTPGPAVTAAEVRRIAEVLGRRGFTGDELVIAVPPEKLFGGPLELPPRSATIPIESLIRNEFCRAQKLEPHAVEIAHWNVPPPARTARGTHVMVAACPHDLATQWVENFAAVGWDVIGLDVRPLAVARACANMLSAAAGLAAIIDLGWSAATIVVLDREVVVFDRRFEDFGLSKLHSSFAAQLRMTEELADALLWSPHGLEDGATSEGLLVEAKDALRVHFEALSSEVVASIQYVSKRYPETVLERALLIGGGAALSDVTDFFAATLGVECSAVTPLSGASCAPALVAECTPALTLAAGLARYTDD